VKDIFAKPFGTGSSSRQRSRPGSRSINVDAKVNDPHQALPMVTPRTRLKNHCHQAADKLGTIPCDPPTEHRMKIARMRRECELLNGKRNNKVEEVEKDRYTNTRDKRKINVKPYQCTPLLQKRKIRPRSDGRITITQQRGFIAMRDKLCEQGIMSKDIRKDLHNEEIEQMMHLGARAKVPLRQRRR